MSSWAEVAASGPPQSAEEVRKNFFSRANPVDEVIPVESSVGSLIDVDSGVSVVESDFLEKDVQTETQARRLQLEAQVAEQAAKEEKEAMKRQRKADKKSSSASTSTSASASSSSLAKQFQNPVVLANAVTVAAVSALLGFVGFKKHQAGQLSWKVVGLGSAFVAAFGTADYFVSSYLFKKYPPKK